LENMGGAGNLLLRVSLHRVSQERRSRKVDGFLEAASSPRLPPLLFKRAESGGGF
jgi:hypothetical protein